MQPSSGHLTYPIAALNSQSVLRGALRLYTPLVSVLTPLSLCVCVCVSERISGGRTKPYDLNLYGD